MITTEGIIIRILCSDISVLRRITSGVKLINLDDNVKVAGIAKVREKEEGPSSTETEGPAADVLDETPVDEGENRQEDE